MILTHYDRTRLIGFVDEFFRRQRDKNILKGMPGSAILEYQIVKGPKKRITVDMRRETFRASSSGDELWDETSDFSLIKKGSTIEVYWDFFGKWVPSKVCLYAFPLRQRPYKLSHLT